MSYLKAEHEVAEAQAMLHVINEQVEKTQLLIAAQQQHYERLLYDYQHNRSASYDNAVSKIVVHSTLKEKDAAHKTLLA